MRRWDIKLDKFGITQNRYRELLYFCRQYPEWCAELRYNNDGLRSPQITGMPGRSGITGDPTGELATRRAELQRNCELIERAAIEADAEIYQYIIRNVTNEGEGYTFLRQMLSVPCSRDKFYAARRKFFWLLDKKKK